MAHVVTEGQVEVLQGTFEEKPNVVQDPSHVHVFSCKVSEGQKVFQKQLYEMFPIGS